MDLNVKDLKQNGALNQNHSVKLYSKKRFPKTTIYGDIRKIDFTKLEKVEILTGGFPCQDVSYAGKRKGMDGERTILWKEYARAISEIRPKYAIMENVPGLITLGLEQVLTDLTEIGYDAEWTTLRASDFGAIHKRERIFIIAYPCSKRHMEYKSKIESDKTRIKTLDELNTSIITNANGRNVETYRKTGSRAEIYQSEKNLNDASNNESEQHSFANSDSERYGRRSDEEIAQTENDAEIQRRSTPRFFADDWSKRIERFREESLQGGFGFSWCKNVRRIEDIKGRQDIPEPLFRGSRDGIPAWMDRIKSLGNAVVPQCAQFIARQIKEYEKENN